MPTATLEDFEFMQEEGKVALRQTKSNTDKPRERRSWGTSEVCTFALDAILILELCVFSYIQNIFLIYILVHNKLAHIIEG